MQNEDEQIVVAGKDLELLKSTALSMGITPQELLSRLVSSEIRHRYVNPSLTSASVVPFRRRRIDAAIPNFPVTQEAQK